MVSTPSSSRSPTPSDRDNMSTEYQTCPPTQNRSRSPLAYALSLSPAPILTSPAPVSSTKSGPSSCSCRQVWVAHHPRVVPLAPHTPKTRGNYAQVQASQTHPAHFFLSFTSSSPYNMNRGFRSHQRESESSTSETSKKSQIVDAPKRSLAPPRTSLMSRIEALVVSPDRAAERQIQSVVQKIEHACWHHETKIFERHLHANAYFFLNADSMKVLKLCAALMDLTRYISISYSSTS